MRHGQRQVKSIPLKASITKPATKWRSTPATGKLDSPVFMTCTDSYRSCTLVKDSSTVFSGTANYTNCYVEANANSGCTVIDGNSTSYGEEFATAGGGVWVTEFAKDGIS